MNHIELATYQYWIFGNEQRLSREYLQAVARHVEDLEKKLVAALEKSQLREAK